MNNEHLCKDEGCPQHGTDHVCVNKAATERAIKHIKLAASAWQPGTPLAYITGFAWGAGFDYEQTLLECSAAGYSMCVAGPRIKADWARMDAEYLAYQLTQEEGYVPTTF